MLMKRLLSLLVSIACLSTVQAAKVDCKITGVQSGDTAVVSMGSDAYLATIEVSVDGTCSFNDVPAGKMFLKIEASGYNLPKALIIIENEDGCVEPVVPQTMAVTKMDSIPNIWNQSWQEDASFSDMLRDTKNIPEEDFDYFTDAFYNLSQDNGVKFTL